MYIGGVLKGEAARGGHRRDHPPQICRHRVSAYAGRGWRRGGLQDRPDEPPSAEQLAFSKEKEVPVTR